jgi:hypothetical protein
MSREWYRFFLNLFTLTGNGSNQISLEELQLSPPPSPSVVTNTTNVSGAAIYAFAAAHG